MAMMPTGPQPSQAPGVIAGAANRMQQREQALAAQQLQQQQLQQRAMELQLQQQNAMAERQQRAMQFEFQRAKENAALSSKYGKEIRYTADRSGGPGKFEAVSTGSSEEDRESQQKEAEKMQRLALFQSLAPDWARENPEDAKVVATAVDSDEDIHSIAKEKNQQLQREKAAETYTSKRIADLWPEFLDEAMGGIGPERAEEQLRLVQDMIKAGRDYGAIDRHVERLRKASLEDWAVRNHNNADLAMSNPQAFAKAKAVYDKLYSSPDALLERVQEKFINQILNPSELHALEVRRDKIQQQKDAYNANFGYLAKQNPEGYQASMDKYDAQLEPLNAQIKQLENRRQTLAEALTNANQINDGPALIKAVQSLRGESAPPAEPAVAGPVVLDPTTQGYADQMVQDMMQYSNEDFNREIDEIQSRAENGGPGADIAEYVLEKALELRKQSHGTEESPEDKEQAEALVGAFAAGGAGVPTGDEEIRAGRERYYGARGEELPAESDTETAAGDVGRPSAGGAEIPTGEEEVRAGLERYGVSRAGDVEQHSAGQRVLDRVREIRRQLSAEGGIGTRADDTERYSSGRQVLSKMQEIRRARPRSKKSRR